MKIDLINNLVPNESHIFRDELSYQEYIKHNSHELELFKYPHNQGFCPNCDSIVDFNHLSHIGFSSNNSFYLNLREGFICSKCHLNNRQRLLYFIVKYILKVKQVSQTYISERLTALYYKLLTVLPTLRGSEYLGSDKILGQKYEILVAESEKLVVQHQDITQLSYADSSLELVLSGDVLEHIPEYELALKDLYRVLIKNGVLLFSIPFSDTRKTSLVRAYLRTDGEIVHLMPAEIHGNPIDPSGSLAYHSFGWDILDTMHTIGFQDVAAIYLWNSQWGFTHTNSPVPEHFMGPILFMAIK